jgi:hypothetical protein
MEMTRRHFGKITVMAASASTLGLGLTGCTIDQTTIAALLNEMITAWQSIETALGKAVPANVVALFTQAVNDVKAWVPGTPAQDVIQVLQDLSVAVGALGSLTPITAIEAAGIQIVLGTIINVIELIDPAAVPATTITAQAKMLKTGPPVPQQHFRQGQITAKALKAQFEAEWLAQTGKAA